MDTTDYERLLIDIEARVKANSQRLDRVISRQDKFDDLVTAVSVLANREEIVEKDVREIKADVKNLTSKSGKRWDAMIEKIIMVVIAAVVGYFLAQMGMA